MGKREFAVRTGANAKIVTKLPVIQVMPALVFGPRIGRDFVARTALLGRHLGDAVHHGVGRVLFGQGRRVLGKHRVGLDREVIDRHMWRLKRQGRLHILRQFSQVLPRQGIHDVEVEGIERHSRFFDRCKGLRAVMHAAQGLQVLIIEALHAHRQAAHPSRAVGFETVFLKGARIGFEGDFAIGFQTQTGSDAADQTVNARW